MTAGAHWALHGQAGLGVGGWVARWSRGSGMPEAPGPPESALHVAGHPDAPEAGGSCASGLAPFPRPLPTGPLTRKPREWAPAVRAAGLGSGPHCGAGPRLLQAYSVPHPATGLAGSGPGSRAGSPHQPACGGLIHSLSPREKSARLQAGLNPGVQTLQAGQPRASRAGTRSNPPTAAQSRPGRASGASPILSACSGLWAPPRVGVLSPPHSPANLAQRWT